MGTSVRQIVIATTPIVGRSAFAVAAAPPAANDPTVVHASATTNGQATPAGDSMAGKIEPPRALFNLNIR